MNALVAAAVLLAQAPAPQQSAPPPAAPAQNVPGAAATPADTTLLAARQPAGPVLTLPDALRGARTNNLDLKVAQARLDQAKQLARKAWSNYLPQLSVAGSYTYNNVEAKLQLPTRTFIRDVGQPTSAPGGGIPGEPTTLVSVPDPSSILTATIQAHNQFGAQAKLSQAIIAPQLFPAIQSAYLAEDSATLSVDSARRDVLLGVAQLYYGALNAKQALAVQRDILATNLDHEKDATVKVQSGAQPKVVLLRAQIDRIRAEEDVRSRQNDYDAARIALSTLLDREPDFEVTDPPPPPALPPIKNVDDIDKAISQRPDVQAAKVNEEIAQKTKLSTKLAYLPTLGANGVFQASNIKGFTGSYDVWAITLGLNWTLFDGGLREANLREANYKMEEASYSAQSAALKARDEVRRAQIDLETARANQVKAEEQARLARENAQLVKVSFEAGVATYIEVADATDQLRLSELSSTATTLNTQLSVLRLAKALGVFDPQ